VVFYKKLPTARLGTLWTPRGVCGINVGMTQAIQAPKGMEVKSQVPVKVKYCLYARKSTESEERQILSIDSQIKEMLQLAEREKP